MSDAAVPAPEAAPSAGACIAGGAVAAAISLVCLAPPGIHFLTGPLGPVIGAAIVTKKLGTRGSAPWLVAGSLAVFAVGGASLALYVLSRVLVADEYGDGIQLPLPPPSMLGPIAAGLFVHQLLFGLLGTKVGGFLKKAGED